MGRTYIAKVKKDDRIHMHLGENKLVEIHVKSVGKTVVKVALIMHETVRFHHEKSGKLG